MKLDRRTFFCYSIVGLVPACASLATVPLAATGDKLHLVVRNHPNLARPGGFLRIRPVGDPRIMYVLALDAGAFAVVSPICKHQGCTVDVTGSTLTCPCHGSMYARDGRVLRGPTEAPLDRFQTTYSPDGVLTIDLEVSPQ